MIFFSFVGQARLRRLVFLLCVISEITDPHPQINILCICNFHLKKLMTHEITTQLYHVEVCTEIYWSHHGYDPWGCPDCLTVLFATCTKLYSLCSVDKILALKFTTLMFCWSYKFRILAKLKLVPELSSSPVNFWLTKTYQ